MTFWQSFKINWTEVAHVAIYGTPQLLQRLQCVNPCMYLWANHLNTKHCYQNKRIPTWKWVWPWIPSTQIPREKENTMLDWRIFMLPTCPLYHNRTREQSFTILRCYVSNHGHTTTSIIQLEVPKIGVPQIIKVRNEHDLVLKPMVAFGVPEFWGISSWTQGCQGLPFGSQFFWRSFQHTPIAFHRNAPRRKAHGSPSFGPMAPMLR